MTGVDRRINERIWDRSLVLTAIVVAIVSIASLGVAWKTSANVVSRFSFLWITVVFSAALVSYSLRILRFYFFLSRGGVPISLRDTLVVQVVGFALSVTPGRVGEIFKLHLIRERAGVPVMQTAPLLFLDRLTEGGGFMTLALVSALALPALRDQTPLSLLTLVGLALICVFALTREQWKRQIAIFASRLSKSQIGSQIVPHLENLTRGAETSFTPSQILGGLGFSVCARFADGLVVLFVAQMLGVALTLPAAVFILAVSGLAGGVSFLPAGTGAVEATMAGMLVIMGVPLSNAIAIALVTRLFILWVWVALGLVMVFRLRLALFDSPPKASGEL